jgi:hypothetical protein
MEWLASVGRVREGAATALAQSARLSVTATDADNPACDGHDDLRPPSIHDSFAAVGKITNEGRAASVVTNSVPPATLPGAPLIRREIGP